MIHTTPREGRHQPVLPPKVAAAMAVPNLPPIYGEGTRERCEIDQPIPGCGRSGILVNFDARGRTIARVCESCAERWLAANRVDPPPGWGASAEVAA